MSAEYERASDVLYKAPTAYFPRASFDRLMRLKAENVGKMIPEGEVLMHRALASMINDMEMSPKAVAECLMEEVMPGNRVPEVTSEEIAIQFRDLGFRRFVEGKKWSEVQKKAVDTAIVDRFQILQSRGLAERTLQNIEAQRLAVFPGHLVASEIILVLGQKQVI